MPFSDSIPKSVEAHIIDFTNKLRRRQIVGSHNIALHAVKLLRVVISSSKWATFEALIQNIKELESVLQEAQPKELVVGNMFRRVIKFLKEEYTTALSSSDTITPQESGACTPMSLSGVLQPETPGISSPSVHAFPFAPYSSSGSSQQSSTRYTDSIFDLLSHRGLLPLGIDNTQQPLELKSEKSSKSTQCTPAASAAAFDFSRKSMSLKPIFADAITELKEELEMVYEAVATHATQHIHSSEIILTIGYSKTVESFLLAAARKRKFTVVVAEGAPSCSGRQLAKALDASPAISVYLIPDASIFSVMSRVSKVFIGAHNIFADGSLVALTGTLPVCQAAKAHLVPVVVCSGLFKFCPLLLDHGESSDDLGSPEQVLRYGLDENLGVDGRAEVLNPIWDRVPAEYISMFITNLNAYPSSFVYRLLHDLYGL